MVSAQCNLPWVIKGLPMIGVASVLLIAMLTPLAEFLESNLTLHMIVQHLVFIAAGFLFSCAIDYLILVGSCLSKMISHAHAVLLRANSLGDMWGIVAFVLAALLTAYWHVPTNFNAAILNA